MANTIPKFDRALLCALCSGSSANTGIMVFYTGPVIPEYCSAMPRDPLPGCGHLIDAGFSPELQRALRENSSIHDGAIMCGRISAKDNYKVTGWSYRLHPPPNDGPVLANKGSAFNSGLAMSCIESVDKVLFWSSGRAWCFDRGSIIGPVQG